MKDNRPFLFAPRIIRSMESDCWGKDGLSHAELESANRVYTDRYLANAADQGFDSVWVHVAEKMSGLRKHGVAGFLGCWNIGGELSPMTRLAGKMSLWPALSPIQALRETAVEEFGEEVADDVLKAWKLFSDGWKEYPTSCAFTWNSPINYAPAFYFPLEVPDKPSLCTAGHTPLPRDAKGHLNVTSYYLPNWTAPFGVKRTEKALTLLLNKWEQGLVISEENL